MKTFVLLSALGLAILLPDLSQAAGSQAPLPQGPAQALPGKSVPGPRVTGAYVIACYTCGGSYPYRVATGALGGTNSVWEYGSSCSGGLAWRSDANPYFCASRQ
jgi:hypothetical protein